MAGSVNQNDDDVISQINVVPLVDIILVLLIIFMVTADFFTQREKPPPGIEVELPKAASAEPTEKKPIAIVINKAGQLFLNGRPTTPEALKAAVQKRATEVDELEAVIAADQAVPHGEFVRVVDWLRLLGVDRFAINTKEQDIE